jgi:hypothetical protein
MSMPENIADDDDRRFAEFEAQFNLDGLLGNLALMRWHGQLPGVPALLADLDRIFGGGPLEEDFLRIALAMTLDRLIDAIPRGEHED